VKAAHGRPQALVQVARGRETMPASSMTRRAASTRKPPLPVAKSKIARSWRTSPSIRKIPSAPLNPARSSMKRATARGV